MDVRSVQTRTLDAQIHLDDICPLRRSSFQILLQERLNENLASPYIIALTKDHFGNLFFYDAYSLHSHFSILLDCSAKIHYFICKNYEKGFVLLNSVDTIQEYLLSSPHKKQQENELNEQMRCCSITNDAKQP